MIDVLCIGHACVDMNVLVPFFPRENGKQEISHLQESGGGPAANAAYLLSAWGVPTAFAGLVGDDDRGKRVAEEFGQVGTDLSLLERRNRYETPFSIVMVNEQNGSRTIINRKHERSFLSAEWIDQASLSPRVILFDGHEPEASLRAIERFPYAKTVLDAGSLRKGTRLLAEKVDYLVSSERFALAVTGLTDLRDEAAQDQCLASLRKIAPGQIVVTMGERGLIFDHHGRTDRMPAYKVPVIDTTAAGDIFHGAFVYGLLNRMSIVDILKLASATAALSVSREGGRPSIPTREEVILFLERLSLP